MDEIEELRVRRMVRLERYAKILAHVLHFGTDRTAEVVARFGLEIEQWRVVDAVWIETLALGRQRGQRGQALDFSATLAQARARLARECPPLEAVRDLDLTIEAAGARDAQSAGAGGAVLPSYLRSEKAPPPRTAVPLPAPVLAPAPPSFIAPAPPAPAPEAKSPKAQLAGTIPISEGERLAALARQILPFNAPASSEKKPAAPSEPAPPPPAPPPPAPPPPAPAPPEPPPLTLEQRASLHVDLLRSPEQRPQILLRYGLSAEQHARSEADWQAKIAQDATLRVAWEETIARYRAWLAQTGPR